MTPIPDYIETNLQGTSLWFRIPTNPSKEIRGERRKITRISLLKWLLARKATAETSNTAWST